MGLKQERIVERYDIAVLRVAELAKKGYTVVPLTTKLVGIVMYVTMEINDEQLEGKGATKTEAEVVKTEAVLTETESSPVSAKVTTEKAGRAPRKTKQA